MTKLTPSQIQSNLEAYKHAMEVGHKRDIEFYFSFESKWNKACDDISFELTDIYRLRPKPPEPKWRAWTYKDCPRDSWLRRKGMNIESKLGSVFEAGLSFHDGGSTVINCTYQKVLDNYEVSYDHGKTWQPAGVLE